MMEKSLYERLGGVFAIAAVINRFSDEVVKNQVAGQMSQNPALREWHTKQLERLPGLKWMRTLWVCDVAGGPFQYTGTKPGATQMGLEKAHSSFFKPLEAVIVIFCSLPVPRSFAWTFTIPLASISKVTSICGMPRKSPARSGRSPPA